MQPSVDHLLVAANRLEDFADGELGQRGQRPELRDQLRQRLALPLRQRASRDAKVGGVDNPGAGAAPGRAES